MLCARGYMLLDQHVRVIKPIGLTNRLRLTRFISDDPIEHV